MDYPFNATEAEVDHAFNFYCGLESIQQQLRTEGRITPVSYQEHYALSVLDTKGISIKNIEGAEGLGQSILRSVTGVFDWVLKRFFQYNYIVYRWAESKISGSIMRSIYSKKNVSELATFSLFSPDVIVNIITDPGKEEARIKKLEGIANKGIDSGKAFPLPDAALYPVISMAKQSKGNGELVKKAISSAGSVDKLISNHRSEYSNITVDTNAYVKVYDTLTKRKEAVVEAIKTKLDSAEHTISAADRAIKGDVWLNTFPSDLKKNFHLTTDFSNGASIVNRIMLKNLLRALQIDVEKLKGIERKLDSSDKEAASKMAHATKLLKIYSGIVDELMEYERQVAKAQNYASSVSAEALYKIIIAAAKAEVKA